MASECRHSRKRLFERYGINIKLERLAAVVRQGKAIALHTGQDTGRTIYDVPWTEPNGKKVLIRVVMDPQLQTVVTVLPPVSKTELAAEAKKRAKQKLFRVARRHFKDDDQEDFQ